MAASVVGTVSGVLSMQSLLYAVGLGSGAIPTAAALNWVLKDGLGQLGGVLFASAINQRFDAEPRRWRFKSAAVLDASILLEVLTPWFPQHFLLIASVANIGKNVGWLSASATRAGIHRSFMRVENLADITGKAGSQSIAASVIGTGLGIGISSAIGQSTTVIFGATAALSAVHLFCTYRALQTVTIRTFNLQRFWVALRPALDYEIGPDRRGLARALIVPERVLDPDAVSAGEQFLHFGNLSSRRVGHSVLAQDPSAPAIFSSTAATVGLKIGAPASVVFGAGTSSTLSEALSAMERYGDKHLVSVAPGVVHLLFLEEATPRETLRGLLHAVLTHQVLAAGGATRDAPQLARSFFTDADFEALLDRFSHVGWDADSVFIEPFRSRIRLAQLPPQSPAPARDAATT